MPRLKPVGRDGGELEVMDVAATVGAAGAGAVNMLENEGDGRGGIPA